MTTTISISRNITTSMSKNVTALEISDGKVTNQWKTFKKSYSRRKTMSTIMTQVVPVSSRPDRTPWQPSPTAPHFLRSIALHRGWRHCWDYVTTEELTHLNTAVHYRSRIPVEGQCGWRQWYRPELTPSSAFRSLFKRA